MDAGRIFLGANPARILLIFKSQKTLWYYFKKYFDFFGYPYLKIRHTYLKSHKNGEM